MSTTSEQRRKHTEYMRGWRAIHRDEVRARDRAYGATPEGRVARNRALAAWKRRNPTSANAHHMVWRALKTGRLVKLPCQDCGSPKTEGHHDRGYDAAHQLDVVWLCRPHHQRAHGRGPLANR